MPELVVGVRVVPSQTLETGKLVALANVREAASNQLLGLDWS